MTVDADHVTAIARIVLEPLAADVAGEQLDVRMCGDVVLEVVPGEEPLTTEFADVHSTFFSWIVLKIEGSLY